MVRVSKSGRRCWQDGHMYNVCSSSSCCLGWEAPLPPPPWQDTKQTVHRQPVSLLPPGQDTKQTVHRQPVSLLLPGNTQSKQFTILLPGQDTKQTVHCQQVSLLLPGKTQSKQFTVNQSPSSSQGKTQRKQFTVNQRGGW